MKVFYFMTMHLRFFVFYHLVMITRNMQIQFLVLDPFHNGRQNKYYINFCSACEKTLALLLRGKSMIISHSDEGRKVVIHEKVIDNDKLDQPFMKEVYFGPKFGWVLIFSRKLVPTVSDFKIKLSSLVAHRFI